MQWSFYPAEYMLFNLACLRISAAPPNAANSIGNAVTKLPAAGNNTTENSPYTQKMQQTSTLIYSSERGGRGLFGVSKLFCFSFFLLYFSFLLTHLHAFFLFFVLALAPEIRCLFLFNLRRRLVNFST